MNKEILKQEFKIGFKEIKFDYDKIAMTWGVSHYRFAKSQKQNFAGIEEFFKEVMLNPNGLESSIGTSIPWSKRTDFEQYVDGLKLTDSTEEILNNWLSDSIKEAKEYEKDWIGEQDFDLNNIELPKKHRNVVEIKETVNPRFYINTYTGFISENEEEYFFYESQFES